MSDNTGRTIAGGRCLTIRCNKKIHQLTKTPQDTTYIQTMTYDQLMYMHLLTVVPCFFIGALLLIIRKGTGLHRKAGWVYVVLMTITAFITLFMEAHVGPQFFGHFGYIHLFSFLTIYSAPTAIIAIRRGQVRKHKIKMVMLYFGALVIAGGFTFVPGRFMYEFFFG